MKGKKKPELVYLLLGANLGNPKGQISQAIEYITIELGKIQEKSLLYESSPWGVDHKQANYLNQAVSIYTTKTPFELLQEIHKIELKLGRQRINKNESRTIDIDILLWNHKIVKENSLEIPHPRLHLRKFALVPLAELNPQLIHPIFNQSISTLLHSCKDDSNVQKFNEQNSL